MVFQQLHMGDRGQRRRGGWAAAARPSSKISGDDEAAPQFPDYIVAFDSEKPPTSSSRPQLRRRNHEAGRRSQCQDFADGADYDSIEEISKNPLIKCLTTDPMLMRSIPLPASIQLAASYKIEKGIAQA